jgi:hypothetical protein
VNRDVSLLDEARQKADEHGAGLRFGEFFGEYRDGGGRGYLAQVKAAYSVGYSEEIAVGAGLVARGGDKRSHSVFIISANFSEVACLTELKIQHVRRSLTHLPD